jgi:hypothetical protein
LTVTLEQTPKVQVWLDAPIARVQGRSWPSYTDGRLMEATVIDEPQPVIVHLPGGRPVRMESMLTTIRQQQGVVQTVSLLPLKELSDYSGTIQQVIRIVSELGLDAERKLTTRLESWQQTPPDPGAQAHRRTIGAELEPASMIYTEVVPYGSGDGWYAVILFGVRRPQARSEVGSLPPASRCPACNAGLRPNARFCSICGLSVATAPAAAVCTHCGNVLRAQARFCGACGKPVAGDPR